MPAQPQVPLLQTDRLLLRGWEPRDCEPYAEISADPEVMRYLGSRGVLDAGTSWRDIAMHIGHWALRGYGQWVLERRDDGAFLGRAGLWFPAGWPGVEVGWKLARHAWGQGYATEAGLAAVEWAWGELEIDQLISVIHPDNDRSMRVAQRLGMTPLREDEVKGNPVVIFGVDRPR